MFALDLHEMVHVFCLNGLTGHAQGLQLDHLLPLREGGDPPLPKLEGDLHQVIGRTPETLPEMNSRRLLLLMSGNFFVPRVLFS